MMDALYEVAINHKANSVFVTCYSPPIITKISANGMCVCVCCVCFCVYFCVCLCVQFLSCLPGIKTTFAGSGVSGNTDGVGTAASFARPFGIAVDQQTGNLFVCDQTNHSIRKINPQGVFLHEDKLVIQV